jgi:hypothetical protein
VQRVRDRIVAEEFERTAERGELLGAMLTA